MTKVRLAETPQFDYKDARSIGAGSVVPANIQLFGLPPNFYHRRIYVHAAEMWVVKLTFKLAGFAITEFQWSSRLFPPVPLNNDYRFSRLEGGFATNSKNCFGISGASQSFTTLRPFYIIGKFDELFALTIDRDQTNQDWFLAVYSQSHW